MLKRMKPVAAQARAAVPVECGWLDVHHPCGWQERHGRNRRKERIIRTRKKTMGKDDIQTIPIKAIGCA